MSFDKSVEDLWREYAACWSIGDDGRGDRLEACVVADVVYIDPQSVAEGVVALSAYQGDFQRTVPGGRFEIVGVLHHHGQSLARWRLHADDGRVLQTGTSAAVHALDGRLATITGFFDPPAGNASVGP
jgi:hypothetical protein